MPIKQNEKDVRSRTMINYLFALNALRVEFSIELSFIQKQIICHVSIPIRMLKKPDS